ncbi:hypothetical protein K458DRAFT_392009 [Lentithecium fluviatile CBS 122367]|uniref:Uncharacterized protein n=1 Tax=Lentithecium fluviatile CBS 122367 TaxID=1168545 RepID=A0A6G1ISI7_9PLEO|nr:hypothetical protein K458DRAFT_392009 [Lentithecium fluviatile CBS 122367]
MDAPRHSRRRDRRIPWKAARQRIFLCEVLSADPNIAPVWTFRTHPEGMHPEGMHPDDTPPGDEDTPPPTLLHWLTMFASRAPTNPFPIFNLPPELRIQIYSSIVHTIDLKFGALDLHQRMDRMARRAINRVFRTNLATSTLNYGLTEPYWVLHETVCDMTLLRGNLELYADAKPAIMNAFKQRYKNGPAYHVSCHGYSVLEMMAHMNRIRFRDGRRLGRRGPRERLGGIDSWGTEALSGEGRRELRRRRRKFHAGYRVHVDYYPLRNRSDAEEDGFDQDLALLQYLSGIGGGNFEVHVQRGEGLVPLASYLASVSESTGWEATRSAAVRSAWINIFAGSSWPDRGDRVIHARYQSFPCPWLHPRWSFVRRIPLWLKVAWGVQAIVFLCVWQLYFCRVDGFDGNNRPVTFTRWLLLALNGLFGVWVALQDLL